MTEDLVAVARPPDEATANIIKIALDDAGLNAVVHSFHGSVFDGIFTPSEGAWGEVLVERADADRAAAVLKEYAEQNPDESREES